MTCKKPIPLARAILIILLKHEFNGIKEHKLYRKLKQFEKKGIINKFSVDHYAEILALLFLKNNIYSVKWRFYPNTLLLRKNKKYWQILMSTYQCIYGEKYEK